MYGHEKSGLNKKAPKIPVAPWRYVRSFVRPSKFSVSYSEIRRRNLRRILAACTAQRDRRRGSRPSIIINARSAYVRLAQSRTFYLRDKLNAYHRRNECPPSANNAIGRSGKSVTDGFVSDAPHGRIVTGPYLLEVDTASRTLRIYTRLTQFDAIHWQPHSALSKKAAKYSSILLSETCCLLRVARNTSSIVCFHL